MKKLIFSAVILLVATTLALAQSYSEKNLKKLKEGSCWEKVEAAKELGRLRYRPAIPVLKEALKDEFSRVRVAAAKALLGLGDRTGLDMFLAGLASDKKKEVIDAVEALREMEAGEAAGDVAKLLANKDVTLRETAAYTLSFLGNDSVGKALVQGLKDTDRRVRRACAYALGELKYADAADALIELLGKDKAPEVRLRCADALGKMQAKGAVKTLEARLTDTEVARNFPEVKDGKITIEGLYVFHREEPVAVTAVRALGGIGTKEAVDALINCLKAKDSDTLKVAVQYLGKLGDKRAINPIKSLIGQGEEMPDYMVTALALLGDESTKSQLVEVTIRPRKNPNDWSFKHDMSFTIIGFGLEKLLVATVRRILRDPKESDKDKESAMWALTHFGEEKKRAIPEIAEIMRSGSPWLQKRTLYILMRICDERATQVLMKYASEHKGEELRNALDALGKTGDKRATDFIIMNYFDHPNPRVRRNAICAVRDIKDKRAIPALKKIFDTHTDKKMRSDALHAIRWMSEESLIPWYASILCNEKDRSLKNGVIVALFRHMRNDKAQKAILDLLKRKDAEDAWKALGYLRQYAGFKQAVSHILPYLSRDMPSKVRFSAIRALMVLSGAEIVDTISPYLKDKDLNVAARAAAFLAKAKDKRGTDALIGMIRDTTTPFHVRDYLLCAIMDYKVMDAEDAVIKLLDDPHSEIRAGACVVLGNAGMQKGREPLLAILKDELKKQLHYDAAYGLARLGDKRVEPFLRTLTETETGIFQRDILRKCLCRLKGKSVAEYYRSILGKISPNERFEMMDRYSCESNEDLAIVKMLSEYDPSPRVRGKAIVKLRELQRRREEKEKERKNRAEINRLLLEASKDKKK